MKRVSKYILSVIAAAVVLPASLSAQGKIELSKQVKDNLDGTYTLNLETYVTGQQVQKPLDIVLVLDNSNSMYSYNTSDGTKRIVALKGAVNTFIDNIYDSGKCPDHRLAIVKFNGGGRRIDKYVNFDPDNLRAQNLMDRNNITWVNMSESDQVSAAKKNVGTKATGDDSVLLKFSETGTPAAEGLLFAKQLLEAPGIVNDGRQKVVLFFTDGCCGTGEEWGKVDNGGYDTNPYGYPRNTVIPNRYYAQTVVDQANALKSIASVYCVGTFGNLNDTQKADTYFYLRHISSTYNTSIRVDGNVPETNDNTAPGNLPSTQLPSATGGEAGYYYNEAFHSVDTGDKSLTLDSNGYVFDASKAEDLKSAFDQISQKIIETASLDENSAVVLDVITNRFRLPVGKTIEELLPGIHLYTCDVDATNTSDDVKWKTSGDSKGHLVYKDKDNNIVASPVTGGHAEWWVPYTPWEDTDKTIADYIAIEKVNTQAAPDSQDEVQVTGYDYPGHYVGPTTSAKWSPNGQKLIINFDIVTNPANVGGVELQTNDAVSGVYTKDGQGNLVPQAKYEIPVVYLPYLKIVKDGLKDNESAIFTVEKVTDKSGATIDSGFAKCTVIVSGDNPVAVVKLLHAGWYKVTETSWSWAYDVDGSASQIQQLVTLESDKPGSYLVFNFTNTAKTSTPKHDEAFKTNNLGNYKASGEWGGEEQGGDL